MATRTWTDGGLDGDWNNTANWSGATVPVSTDTVRIDASSRNITGNLDQSAIDLARLEIGPGFTGKVGTSGNYLRIGVNGPVVIDGGAAATDSIYLHGTTADLQTVHVLNVGTATAPGTLTLRGTITTLVVHGGIVVQDSGTITTLWLEGSGGSNDACRFKNVGGTVTTSNLFAGHVEAEDGATGTWTTLNVYGPLTDVVIEDGTLTTFNQYHAGSNVTWSAGSATMTNANIYAGTFQATGSGQTITNATVHDRGVIDASNGSVTFSNAVSRFGNGQVIGSPGQTVQLV